MTLGTKFNWTTDIAAKESKLIAPEFLELKAPTFVVHLLPDIFRMIGKNFAQKQHISCSN
ncbi:MAG: hypothetical protein IPO63_18575 [Bacteroidetes bacterium]|nr:hypothetical protein [Bacteroidota bacterium]